MKSLYNRMSAAEALPYATYTTGTNAGTAVDTDVLGNCFRTVAFVLTVGTVVDGTHTFTLQECAEDQFGGTATAVDAAHTQGTLPAVTSSLDDRIYLFGCTPTKRYVRLVNTTAAGSTGGPMAAVAVLADGRKSPPRRV